MKFLLLAICAFFMYVIITRGRMLMYVSFSTLEVFGFIIVAIVIGILALKR